MPHHVNLK